MKNREPEIYGDAVEHNRIVHERALQRAIERNTVDEQQAPVNGIGDVPVIDAIPYSAAESAPALPTQQGILNWAGGDVRMTPCHQGGEQLDFNSPHYDARGGALFGVDEIARR
jgi:hypothetical protein